MRAFQQQGQSHAGKHICPFYLKNRCIYGDRCINSHCLPENKSFQTSKSIPCKFYLQGSCHNGIKCTFSHNINANSSHTYRRDLKEAIDSKYSNSQSNNLTRCLTNIDTNIVSKTNNKPISPGLTGFSFRQTEKVIKMQSSQYREWGYEASEIYSSYDQLSEKELSIYRSAGNFVPGTIPLSSPSENLCTFS
ncbi:hypothetical protein MS3_00002753 [Schistosoma haematobium]|uniref:Nucleoporin NUP42 n=1 Tax=Schistosoma haematobium TaxID=6185 RepID=A0A095CET2_SCHHA|nr:hypothetical protein MS3_00002753 [Schistosoma haematobium]KAH9589830.1 hypothetical protein MS3_00002753 [Schistosoma haematobium]CAH8644919.1 unnamed protein product [Schistosoma haematobium]